MRIPCPRAFQCTENNLPSLRRAGMLLFLEFRPDIVGFSFLLCFRRSLLKKVLLLLKAQEKQSLIELDEYPRWNL